jgi:hypothetical protein
VTLVKAWGLLHPWFDIREDNSILPPKELKIDIAGGISFERPHQKLFEHLKTIKIAYPDTDPWVFERSKWAITYSSSDEQDAKDTIIEFSSLVRIVNSKFFFPFCIFITDNEELILKEYKPCLTMNRYFHFKKMERPRLFYSDIEILRKMFPDFQKKFRHAKLCNSQIHNSITFLNESWLQENGILETILLVTGFECLFNDDSEGIGRKLAHRTAVILSQDKLDYQSISKAIKDAYKLRCKIVHGNLVGKDIDFISLREQCNLIRNYLCRIIKNLIEEVQPDSVWWDSSDYKKWLKSLDKTHL